MKRFVSVLVSLACMTALFGCGGPSQSSEPSSSSQSPAPESETEAPPAASSALNYYTWRYSDVYPDTNVFESMKSVYPEISITTSGSHDSDQYLQQQKVRLLAKDAMDITSITPQTYKEYVDAGYLMDLTGQPFLENYTKSSLDSVTIDGKIYAVPTAVNMIGVWYNKDLFQQLDLEVPATWDDFLAVCESIKASGVTPLVDGGKDGWTMEFPIYPFMHKLMVDDPEIFQKVDNGELKYTDAIFMDTFQQIDAFFKLGYVHKDLVSLTGDQATNLFAQGEAGMVIQGDWFANGLQEKAPEFEVGVFPVPIPGEDGKVVIPLTVGSYDAIAESSVNKDACLKVLDYMSQPESAKHMVDNLNAFSPVLNVDVNEESYLKLWEPMIELEGVDFFYSLQYPGANSQLLKDLQLMFLGELTPEQMAQNLQSVQDKKDQ